MPPAFSSAEHTVPAWSAGNNASPAARPSMVLPPFSAPAPLTGLLAKHYIPIWNKKCKEKRAALVHADNTCISQKQLSEGQVYLLRTTSSDVSSTDIKVS